MESIGIFTSFQPQHFALTYCSVQGQVGLHLEHMGPLGMYSSPWGLEGLGRAPRPHRQRQNRSSTFKMELALHDPGLWLHPSAPSSEVPTPMMAPSHQKSRGWRGRQRAHKGPPAWQPNRSSSRSRGCPGALFPGSYQPDLGVTEASRNGSRGQRFRHSSTQGTAPLWK